MTFDKIIIVDWSGGKDQGPKPKKDAIWACVVTQRQVTDPIYFRNRQVFETWCRDELRDAREASHRVLCGFDFPFGYPTGFAKHLTGSDDAFALWDWIEDRIEDAPKDNNRFAVAAEMNRLCDGIGPFWGNGTKGDHDGLPRKGLVREQHGWPERRKAEENAKGTFTVWQLAGAGSVGSQTLMGLPLLNRLRREFGAALSVWPLEPTETDIVLVEVWPSLLSTEIAESLPEGEIKDAHQVRVLAQAISRLQVDALSQMLDVPVTEEGWIFGLGHEDALKAAAEGGLVPPPLRNDCFAMPQGAYWTPEADALAHLRAAMTPVVGAEKMRVSLAANRVLATDAVAARSHPPTPNSAVDGYAMVGPIAEGSHNLTLVDGVLAAGHVFDGVVADGEALRILTGAPLPDGANTVILQEDVSNDGTSIAFHGPLKAWANARKAGEDMTAGQTVLSAGRRLTSADLGTLTAAGIAQVEVFQHLKVGVLSTGDELRDVGEAATDAQIFDANRPMLLENLQRWGFEAIDLGRAPDDRTKVRSILDSAAKRCDAILTSGGASAGDEDHMSTVLKDTGDFALWRVAVKPGRPLAMGMWNQTPVFGLPGNPVAAQVCSLIFAYPALSMMAGMAWQEPMTFKVPAAFSKSKKDGRTEYLRARIENGCAVPFASEGSGRISGLSWANGLIRLPHEAMTVEQGDLVDFLPFSSFGL